jgi:hypothetical protein
MEAFAYGIRWKERIHNNMVRWNTVKSEYEKPNPLSREVKPCKSSGTIFVSVPWKNTLQN